MKLLQIAEITFSDKTRQSILHSARQISTHGGFQTMILRKSSPLQMIPEHLESKIWLRLSGFPLGVHALKQTDSKYVQTYFSYIFRVPNQLRLPHKRRTWDGTGQFRDQT